LKVEELPVPETLKRAVTESGVVDLYPPQEDAFVKTQVLEGRNLVLASPTASGKTLVAEVCALKHVLEGKGKVLYLTPLRALASEKYLEFQKYSRLTKAGGEKVRIGISTGDLDSSDPWLARYDIIISTNEKTDSLLRHRTPWINTVSLIIADEIHFINDAERGPTLEVVLARLMQVNPKLQVLALSATIRNAEEIASWLNADYVTRDWRPVKLREGVYLHGEVKFNDGHAYRVEETYRNPALNLALNTVKQGGQALIFTGTRKEAVDTAKSLTSIMKQATAKEAKRRLEKVAERIMAAGEKTRLSEQLSKLVENGVAYHHAGLSGVHRGILEESFRGGLVKVLAATPTLAAGVNLPARVVIINSYERYEPGYGRYPIPILEYKQMSGRAGRPKYDKVGEAVLLARTDDEEEYLMESYVNAQPERLWSKLGVERVLRSHVLATVASGFAQSEQGVFDFFDKTLYAFQYDPVNIRPVISKVLQFLHGENMVESDGRYINATKFGKRVSELYIDPISAVTIRDCLYRGAETVTDLSFLHLICHTPDVAPQPYPRRKEMAELETYTEAHRSEFMVAVPTELMDLLEYETFIREVKCARVLEAWINEVTEDGIIERFSVEPGDLFRLLEAARWLIYATYELAVLFGHKDYRLRISQLEERVKLGVKPELLPLTRLEGIGRVRGRSLFNAGYKTVEDLKKASVTELVEVPLVGAQVAKKIKDQVGGKLSEEEAAKLRKGYEREQRLITEYKP